MKLKRWKLVLFAAAALVATAAGVGHAGSKSATVVSVRKNADGSGDFFGELGATRSSSDVNARIWCSTYWFNGDATNVLTTCGAVNAAGLSVGATSKDPTVARVAQSAGPDSRISVSFNAAAQITAISVTTASQHMPKQP